MLASRSEPARPAQPLARAREASNLPAATVSAFVASAAIDRDRPHVARARAGGQRVVESKADLQTAASRSRVTGRACGVYVKASVSAHPYSASCRRKAACAGSHGGVSLGDPPPLAPSAVAPAPGALSSPPTASAAASPATAPSLSAAAPGASRSCSYAMWSRVAILDLVELSDLADLSNTGFFCGSLRRVTTTSSCSPAEPVDCTSVWQRLRPMPAELSETAAGAGSALATTRVRQNVGPSILQLPLLRLP